MRPSLLPSEDQDRQIPRHTSTAQIVRIDDLVWQRCASTVNCERNSSPTTMPKHIQLTEFENQREDAVPGVILP